MGRWSASGSTTPPVLSSPRDADLLWLESPSNPLLGIADLADIGAAPRKPDALLVVDSTFATPLAQRPLELGADLVMHSTTKYLGGHSDLLLGAVVASSGDRARHLRRRRELAGATPGALEAYLAVRGMRTLPLRLQRASASAAELADRLARHPAVEICATPAAPITRPTPPRAASCRALAASSPSTWTGALNGRRRVPGGAGLRHATSLGGVESTIERRAAIPGQTISHPGCSGSASDRTPGDLWGDLEHALPAVIQTGRADHTERLPLVAYLRVDAQKIAVVKQEH